MSRRSLRSLLAVALAALSPAASSAADPTFERVQVTREFHAEGGTAADLDNDGHGEVIVGPWIYWGPDYQTRTKYYPGEAFKPHEYSKNFLMYSDDVDGDKFVDTIVLGFPGAESWWYRNPGKDKARTQMWEQHVMLDVTDNESPMMVDIDGDGIKDLVCASKGHYGYASRAGLDPTKSVWKFHQVTPSIAGLQRFTHGVGVGDVNNDGRMDLMEKDGWWENPGKREGEAAKEPWKQHKVQLANPGGSQMFAVDLDGDGKNEIVTGTSAHGFGLVYYKVLDAANDKLEKVEIMTADDKTSPVGLAISQLHAVDIGDISGDGVPDIVTGKRWWAHHTGDDGSQMPAALVWLETQRSGGRVRFVPHVVDVSAGVGTQVMLTDVNQDKLLDIVSGNKRGGYLFLQVPAGRPADQRYVSADPFDQRLAKEAVAVDDELGGMRPALTAKQPLNFDFESGKTNDWEVRGAMEDTVIAAGAGAHGKFATSAGKEDQGKLVGELISRPFILSQPWLSALVAGGKDPKVCVEVVSEVSGKVIGRFDGTDCDSLERQWLDLKDHVGSAVRVRLVDHLPAKGFASVDDIRMHAKK